MGANSKTLIALFRRENTGKTRTLNKVIDKLSSNYSVNDVREEYLSPVDRLITVNIDGIIVGVSTGGDTEGIVKKRINELLEKNCSIIVTAARSKGKTIDVIDKFSKKNNYKIDWIEKSATYTVNLDKEEFDSRNDKYNETDSEIILQAIHYYLKKIANN